MSENQGKRLWQNEIWERRSITGPDSIAHLLEFFLHTLMSPRLQFVFPFCIFVSFFSGEKMFFLQNFIE